MHTICGMTTQQQLTLSQIFSENVKKHMSQRKLGSGPDALRKHSGVGQGVAVGIVHGTGDNRLSTIEKVAKKFRVTPWQMLLPHVQTPDEFAVTIPRYDNAAGMGKGVALLETDSVVERITVTKPWLQAHIPSTTRPGDLRIITALGDSMEPTLKDGDFVLVDTAINTLDVDGIYVLRDPPEALFIKRVSRIKRDGKIGPVVTSDNPATPPFGTPEGLEVIGKVVWGLVGKKL